MQVAFSKKQESKLKFGLELKGISPMFWWIILVLWALSLVVVFAFVYIPTRQKLPELIEMVSYRNILLDARRGQAIRVQEAEDKLDGLRMEMDSMTESVPSETDVPRILDRLCEVAEKAGGRITGLRYFLPNSIIAEFSSVRVAADFQGSFGALEVLLRLLAEAPFPVAYDSLTVWQDAEDVFPTGDKLYATLDFAVIVSKKLNTSGNLHFPDSDYGITYKYSNLFDVDPSYMLRQESVTEVKRIESLDFRLIGYIVRNGEGVALVEAKGETYVVRAGDYVEDVLVRKVTKEHVVFEAGSIEYVLWFEEM